VNEAAAKLDRAVSREPGITVYIGGASWLACPLGLRKWKQQWSAASGCCSTRGAFVTASAVASTASARVYKTLE
jgi:hypothetical protein